MFEMLQNKLAEGLIKIEKVANFERLERYVELLEQSCTGNECFS